MPVDRTDRPEFGGYVQKVPDAIVTADAETRDIVDVSPSATDFFGYSTDQLQSMDVLDLHPADQRERYEQLFETHLANQPAIISRFEDGSSVVVATADGQHRPVEINAWLVDEGSETRFRGVFRDITDRLEKENSLQRQNERLDEFASVISHDLRNPLSVAEGRATLAADECESEHIDHILSALERMEAIVDDTLTLARNGETVGQTESVSITDVVGQCWGMVETADATLVIEDEFEFEADAHRLQQIFENLLRNAIEHNDDDVTIRVGRAGEGSIYFEDDGEGIPADQRATIFEPGYTSSTDGTGFGLTIVNRLAEAHGWTVTVSESDEGGARFEFAGVEID